MTDFQQFRQFQLFLANNANNSPAFHAYSREPFIFHHSSPPATSCIHDVYDDSDSESDDDPPSDLSTPVKIAHYARNQRLKEQRTLARQQRDKAASHAILAGNRPHPVTYHNDRRRRTTPPQLAGPVVPSTFKQQKLGELQDLAWALELDEKGTKSNLLERIQGHFDLPANATLQTDKRYAVLFGKRKRTDDEPVAGPSTSSSQRSPQRRRLDEIGNFVASPRRPRTPPAASTQHAPSYYSFPPPPPPHFHPRPPYPPPFPPYMQPIAPSFFYQHAPSSSSQ
ncbi:hypothetical protein B0H14DRAFT_2578649 [Mycena olivaceomarginata]|nr:hypothetical protein B0H14DRAFT_2578649 [Mycena olivaceomarginata]